ncbi:uncharacterized protein L3040_000515 [Drepanopeziza brunnea f. sp. 'multigermtubi']|uniref:uncharacterized protein n=1 Tax=Drepanopeziza brunnea f. sp. 'multigermtubi' TaxID=698441 RepID=UPI00238964B6|nr:hypothetical protein L3040_000515 [Drepanopeziza brunnea f. sp. 'multigermtubi']
MLLSRSTCSILLALSFLYSKAYGRDVIAYRTVTKEEADSINEHEKPSRDELFDIFPYSNPLGNGLYTVNIPAGWPAEDHEYYCVIKADREKIEEISKVWVPKLPTSHYNNEEATLKYIESWTAVLDPKKALRFSYITEADKNLQMLIPTEMVGHIYLGTDDIVYHRRVLNPSRHQSPSGQMGNKATLDNRFQAPSYRSIRFRLRSRHLVLAGLILCVYFYTSSSFYGVSYSKFTSRRPYQIQARFPVEHSVARKLRLERRSQVEDAFKHSWKGYKDHAWMHDEVMPVSGGQKDPFVGWAATLVDSLDSLYIMGLKDEFAEALQALEQIDFSKPNADKVPVFEVTIRYLGGLLGAWDVSGHRHPILLQKARELGDFLAKAFDTTSGLPVPYYFWKNATDEKLLNKDGVVIAQIASLSMEFIRLSQVTESPKYAALIQTITDQLAFTQKLTDLPGMWPLTANCSADYLSFQDSRFSLGVLADSAFEYLPKAHLLNHHRSNQYIDMYRMAFSTFSKHLFFRPLLPGNPDILMSGNKDMSEDPPLLDGQFQHLACFVGGMVALGSRISNSKKELETASKLTDGCVWGYSNTLSGIMPDFSHVEPCDPDGLCIWTGAGNGFKAIDDPSYQLRPEAIESVFIMYRLTADPIWMEKGWKMFEAVSKHTKTDIAHARLVDVMTMEPQHEDSMESYWLGETLKYFYLLYSEPGLISLDEFVLNTEAHPFRWAG